MQTKKQEGNITAFMDRIQSIGESAIPDTYKQSMNDSIVEALIQHLITQIAEYVPDNQQKLFGERLESGAAPEEIDAFLQTVVPNYEQVMGEIVRDFFVRLEQQHHEAHS